MWVKMIINISKPNVSIQLIAFLKSDENYQGYYVGWDGKLHFTEKSYIIFIIIMHKRIEPLK